MQYKTLKTTLTKTTMLLLLAPILCSAADDENSLRLNITIYKPILAKIGSTLECRAIRNPAFGYILERTAASNVKMTVITNEEKEAKTYDGILDPSKNTFDSKYIRIRDQMSPEGGMILEFHISSLSKSTNNMQAQVYITEFATVDDNGTKKEEYIPANALSLSCK